MTRTLLLLYPPAWRRRYAQEFLAVIDQVPLSLPVIVDLLGGALDAHFHPSLTAPKRRVGFAAYPGPMSIRRLLLLWALARTLSGPRTADRVHPPRRNLGPAFMA